MSKNFLYLPFFLLALIACGGGDKNAELTKTNMEAIDTIENVELLDSISNEIGDIQVELKARQAEYDSLLTEIEKDEE